MDNTLFASRDALVNWWNELSDSWKQLFYLTYYKQKFPVEFETMLYECREIAGGFSKELEGWVNPHAILHRAESVLPAVIFHTLSATTLLNNSSKMLLNSVVDGYRYKLSADLPLKDTSGLRMLGCLEECYLYYQEGDQPTINASDLSQLDRLHTLHLHLHQSRFLADILLLNLPCLQNIIFYGGMNGLSYYQYLKEEELIESFQQRTRVTLTISSYMD